MEHHNMLHHGLAAACCKATSWACQVASVNTNVTHLIFLKMAVCYTMFTYNISFFKCCQSFNAWRSQTLKANVTYQLHIRRILALWKKKCWTSLLELRNWILENEQLVRWDAYGKWSSPRNSPSHSQQVEPVWTPYIARGGSNILLAKFEDDFILSGCFFCERGPRDIWDVGGNGIITSTPLGFTYGFTPTISTIWSYMLPFCLNYYKIHTANFHKSKYMYA